MMQVFSPEWFKYHQQKIVRFANTRIGRCVFGIPNVLVVAISPGGYSYIVGIDPLRKVAICRNMSFSGAPFAYRLYKFGAPLWWLLHTIDSFVLKNQQMIPNFGFDTLTVYSAAGSNYCFDCDYRAASENVGWSTIRGSSTFTPDVGGVSGLRCNVSTISTDWCYTMLMRVGQNFDTSSIGTSAKITSVSLYGMRYQDYNNYAFWSSGSYHDLVVVKYTPVSLYTPGSTDALTFSGSVLGYLTWGGTVSWPYGWGYTSTRYCWMPISLSVDSVTKGGATSLLTMIRGDYSNVAPDLNPGDNCNLMHDIYSADDSEAVRPYLYVEFEYPIKINIGDSWKDVKDIYVNIGDSWKSLSSLNVNISDVWKTVF